MGGPKLKVLEFYSGIGGMHYGLRECLNGLGISEEEYSVEGAFDINQVANSVYQSNFPSVPHYSKSIESFSKKFYENVSADLYLMSPPCQPYTRVGLQHGSKDPRAKSFLYLLDIITKLESKPKYLLMENVKGFELSDTHPLALDTLEKAGYTVRQFLLSPLDILVPNSRARYFLLAKLSPLSFDDDKSISETILTSIPGTEFKGECKQLSDYLEKRESDYFKEYEVPDKTLEKRGRLFDIVRPEERRCCCFTKAYFHYVEGTGSVLQCNGEAETRKKNAHSEVPKEKSDSEGKTEYVDEHAISLEQLQALHLRYFTPREVANLHCFPQDFSFPNSTTKKQQYRCLGNSLNVTVVAKLLGFLLKDMVNERRDSQKRKLSTD
eukprot:Nk52_evm1s411 gene=Nk52_evmTU1s411